MKCQMQAVGLRLQTIKSTQAMTEAMKGAAKAMKGYSHSTIPQHHHTRSYALHLLLLCYLVFLKALD
jgi:hypothetical protein